MRIIWFLSIIILITVFACKDDGDNNNCSPFEFGIISPYDNPIWYSTGKFIGFNHTPIKEIHYIDGYECPYQAKYIYDYDSSGFWLINIDGSNQRMILPYTLNSPAWSPDGSWITFSRDAQICIMPFNGEQFDTASIVQLTTEGRNFYPSWSPDGEWIAFDSDAESPTGLKFIWKIKKDGSSKKRIAYSPNDGETRMPFWGNDLTILHRRYTSTGSPEIFKMDSAGNNIFQLTTNEYIEKFPSYSHNCSLICYVSQSNKEDGIELWRINGDGTFPIQLTNEGCRSFSWSPEDEIVYLNFDGSRIDETKGTLWIMDADGNNKRQLTQNIIKYTQY